MPWNDQEPEVVDLIISGLKIEVKGEGYGTIYGEIDKLSDGTYRAICGNLFQSHEIIRDRDLEKVLRTVAKTYFRYSKEEQP